ncbi:uncharacterized protein LOC118201589 [Stegodyphus dumicola]|uniref:uncharacterized protein LOC118201589 n=1 Tax=Stegodyphus dumicola TaxID=202533 RepID=UPI0015B32DA8|nr:uncharacterized protein LOC118201589 [Stegodyphus dumicola]
MTTNIMGWIKRFVYNSRHKQEKKRGNLSVSDIDEAEKTIVYLIQQEPFGGLRNKRLQSLDTFLDNGIIRLKSPVLRRDDHEEFKTPAILPGEHPLVKRLVRFSAKGNNPPTAPPPADRIQDAAAFQITGVDFTGLVILRDNSKAWIALFTCAMNRAVHHELVISMSTETFLLAFHRFVARRGKPSVVYSDNGTNVKGATSAFALIDFEKIFLEARKEHITWKFIPSNAPWWRD